MAFNSWQFLVFLIVVFATYFILPKKYRHYFLLIASYFFYAYWNWKLIFLMLLTTAVSYTSGLLIGTYKDKKGLKITFLILTLVVSLGALFFFKYFNFILDVIEYLINAFNGHAQFDALNIILPIGISFYTFQTLSYVIDVYRGSIEAEKNPFYYALYVSFFPQLVAGPIERPENLLPQFKEKEGIKRDNLAIGLRFMLQGFVKKILIADILATVVNSVFNDLSNTNGLLVSVGTICFALQIYGDFSGYSDIAFGTAKLFNITLSKNFDKPYRALSIQDFWRRWHITLSNWFRDYVYIPLGGSKVNWFRWALNILIVFLLSGLWHGAAITFVIFGLMHAIYQIVGRLTIKLRNKGWEKCHVDPHGKAVMVFRTIFTFILVCLAWIPFRANSYNDMLTLYQNLFTNWNVDFNAFVTILDLTGLHLALIIGAIVMFFVVDHVANLPIKNIYVKDIIYVVLAWVVILAFIYLKSSNMDSSFIYFQF